MVFAIAIRPETVLLVVVLVTWDAVVGCDALGVFGVFDAGGCFLVRRGRGRRGGGSVAHCGSGVVACRMGIVGRWDEGVGRGNR